MRKSQIKNSNPGFPELEQALNKAKKELSWKDLTAFLVKWFNKNQTDDNKYSLKTWCKK